MDRRVHVGAYRGCLTPMHLAHRAAHNNLHGARRWSHERKMTTQTHSTIFVRAMHRLVADLKGLRPDRVRQE